MGEVRCERCTLRAAHLPLPIGRKDVIAKAKTGTGKTIAFLLPTIELLSRATTSGRVVCKSFPTRRARGHTRESSLERERPRECKGCARQCGMENRLASCPLSWLLLLTFSCLLRPPFAPRPFPPSSSLLLPPSNLIPTHPPVFSWARLSLTDALAISPTRELASQIKDECEQLLTFHKPKLSCAYVCGGVTSAFHSFHCFTDGPPIDL